MTTDGTHHTDSLIQGDVFSIQKGERHGYDACGTMVLYNISLRQDFLEQFRHLDVLPGWNWFFGNRTGTPRVVVHVPVGQRTRGMENLDRAVAEFRMRPLAYEIMTTSLVVDFLISVMRSAQFLRPSVEGGRGNGVHSGCNYHYGGESDMPFFIEAAGVEVKHERLVFFQEVPGSDRNFSNGISAENTSASSSIPVGLELEINE